jgi:hypothetical protein
MVLEHHLLLTQVQLAYEISASTASGNTTSGSSIQVLQHLLEQQIKIVLMD